MNWTLCHTSKVWFSHRSYLPPMVDHWTGLLLPYRSPSGPACGVVVLCLSAFKQFWWENVWLHDVKLFLSSQMEHWVPMPARLYAPARQYGKWCEHERAANVQALGCIIEEYTLANTHRHEYTRTNTGSHMYSTYTCCRHNMPGIVSSHKVNAPLAL